jgi:hypothetical protein
MKGFILSSCVKPTAEVDQMVVEHTFFLQQMNRFDDVKNLKATLNETHIHLGEKGLIKAPRLKGKAKVVYLYNRYKKVTAIAASIAGITALTISALVWSLSPGKPANKQDIENLSRDIRNINQKVSQVQKQNQVLNQKIDGVKDQAPAESNIPFHYWRYRIFDRYKGLHRYERTCRERCTTRSSTIEQWKRPFCKSDIFRYRERHCYFEDHRQKLQACFFYSLFNSTQWW